MRVSCAGLVAVHVVLTACGRVDFGGAARDGGVADAGLDTPDAVDAALGPWGTPTIRTELHGDGSEADPTVTADRLVIVWSSQRTQNIGSDDLWMADRPASNVPFQNIRQLTELDTVAFDGAPEISADGLTLYFDNPAAGNADFYLSTRASRTAAWGSPQLATDLSSTTASDHELAVSPDRLTAVINRDMMFIEFTRPDTASPFANPLAHPELTISADNASPTIDDDARVIYFHSGGERDLYVARRAGPGTDFTVPASVTDLNTPDRDADPFISADERYMVYGCGDNICEVERR